MLFRHINKAASTDTRVAASQCATSYLASHGSANYSRSFTSKVSKGSSGDLLLKYAIKKDPRTNLRRNLHIDAKQEPVKRRTFFRWYNEHLERSPIKTKMITGAILWGLGDIVAQVVPKFIQENEEEVNEVVKSSQSVFSNYDFPRTGRAFFFGCVIHAPLAHVHYNFLETLTIRCGVTGLGVTAFKTIVEQFVYWSWFSNSLYHGAMGAMQGHNPTQIYNRIADVLWDTQKAQWSFWIPVQLLNFRFVPVCHQLNVVLLTSVVWTALLSAWYPPSDEMKKEEIEN